VIPNKVLVIYNDLFKTLPGRTRMLYGKLSSLQKAKPRRPQGHGGALCG